jgi:hypothetical protein
MAFQITQDMLIKEAGPKEYLINGVRTHCAEHPEYGGWVVIIDKEDTYYCSDSVFRERNVV